MVSLKCCSQSHIHQLRYESFHIDSLRASLLFMCNKTEIELLNYISILLRPMCNPHTGSFTYVIDSHIVCRTAFATYYGLATQKLDRARAMAIG